jgi:hypothetical protein
MIKDDFALTYEEMDKALVVLGPKLVNSIKRNSMRQPIDFRVELNSLVDSKINKPMEWYITGK